MVLVVLCPKSNKESSWLQDEMGGVQFLPDGILSLLIELREWQHSILLLWVPQFASAIFIVTQYCKKTLGAFKVVQVRHMHYVRRQDGTDHGLGSLQTML
jgi:hypothetical protein